MKYILANQPKIHNQKIQNTIDMAKAIEQDNLEAVKEILKRPNGIDFDYEDLKIADPYFKSEFIKECLMSLVARYGNKKILEELVKAGGDINKKENGTPLLYIAAQRGRFSIIDFLIEKGIDINELDSSKKYSVISYILFFNTYSEISMLNIIKYLISKGAKVNDDRIREQPLYFIAGNKKNKKDVIELLLDNGADIEKGFFCKDGINWTPLCKAIELYLYGIINMDETILYLLERGADYKVILPTTGKPIIENVKEPLKSRMLEVMRKRGADLVNWQSSVNNNENNNQELFFDYVKKDKRDFVDLSLKNKQNGIDINAINKNGYTALTYASEHGNFDMVELLLLHNADVKKKDGRGYLPLDAALANCTSDISPIINCIIEAGEILGIDRFIKLVKENKINLVKACLYIVKDFGERDFDDLLEVACSSEAIDYETIKEIVEHNPKLVKECFRGFRAALNLGDHDKIRLFLDNGFELNRTILPIPEGLSFCESQTALYYYINNMNILNYRVEHPNKEIISLLLEYGSKVLDKDLPKNCKSIISMLVAYDIEEKVFPIFIRHFIKNNKLEELSEFLDDKEVERYFKGRVYQIIDIAIECELVEILKFLLTKFPSKYNYSDFHKTYIPEETRKQEVDLLKKAVSKDVIYIEAILNSIHFSDQYMQEVAMPVLTKKSNSYNTLKALKLVDCGAYIHGLKKLDDSPILEAVKNNSSLLTLEFIKRARHYLDLNLRMENSHNQGPTLLFFATDYDVIEILLQNGADPNLEAQWQFVDDKGKPFNQLTAPLHMLCDLYGSYLDGIKLFVQYGADVNKVIDCIKTPLTILTERNYEEAIEYLLTKNIDFTKGHPNNYALNIAVANGNINIIRLLLKHGADAEVSYDTNHLNKKGPALVCIFKNSNPEVLISIFLEHFIKNNEVNKFAILFNLAFNYKISDEKIFNLNFSNIQKNNVLIF